MINKYFANKFIETIRKYTDYNFLVFNTEGIIIAATEKERVGVFHEASYNMMRQGEDIIVVNPEDTKKYLGVKPGVDVTIVHNNIMVGAIGITGIAKEVTPVVIMAKMSIEAMLDYELYKEQMERKKNEREEFYSLLLKGDFKDTERLTLLSQRLFLKLDILRVAIVFEIAGDENNRKEVLAIIQESPKYTSQDFSFINKEDEIVVFKSISNCMGGLFERYDTEIKAFILPAYDKMCRRNFSFEYYVGSLQSIVGNYKFSYRHCLWLRDNNKTKAFFYDYMNDYVQSQIPMLELYGIFDTIGELMDEEGKENFVEMFTALNANNYNLVESSKALHVHKNTLIFRLNKIKELYNINPLRSGEDRAFADYLCRYLKNFYKG